MPLHEWSDGMGWEGVHTLWLTELLRWIKPRLPAGYRAYLGSPPTLAIGSPPERPDVGVRSWSSDTPSTQPNGTDGATAQTDDFPAPEIEIAVAALELNKALQIEFRGRLVAALELVSPRNKDRMVARDTYLSRYVGYLLEGVHLLLVDVHRRPLNFSFADRIAQEFSLREGGCPTPAAISYRVGEPAATGGRFLGIWKRPLQPGIPLPAIPLVIDVDRRIIIDLETTYMRAAADAYLA